jgi:hypothetical protein
MTRSQMSIGVALCLAIAASHSPAGAWSCAQSIAPCQIEGANKENIIEKCRAAGAAFAWNEDACNNHDRSQRSHLMPLHKPNQVLLTGTI